MVKYHFITYATPDFMSFAEANVTTALSVGGFDTAKIYTPDDLDDLFKSKNEFSWDKMKNKIGELLDKYIPEFPKEVKLSFPTIKKIELPKKETING